MRARGRSADLPSPVRRHHLDGRRRRRSAASPSQTYSLTSAATARPTAPPTVGAHAATHPATAALNTSHSNAPSAVAPLHTPAPLPAPAPPAPPWLPSMPFSPPPPPPPRRSWHRDVGTSQGTRGATGRPTGAAPRVKDLGARRSEVAALGSIGERGMWGAWPAQSRGGAVGQVMAASTRGKPERVCVKARRERRVVAGAAPHGLGQQARSVAQIRRAGRNGGSLPSSRVPPKRARSAPWRGG